MTKIIIVCGSPGAGKSTYAKSLATSMRATLLDSDTTADKILRAALLALNQDPDDRESPYYKETFRLPIYDSLFAIAKENIKNNDVILVAPFTKELRNPDWPSELAADLRAKVEVHYLWCNAEIRRQRIIARGSARDKAKLEDWQASMAYYDDGKRPDFSHVFIDTSNESA